MKPLQPKRRKKAFLLLIIMILEILAPIPTWALGGGPDQPEFRSFVPANVTEMVDVGSGSFAYNIPLGQIGNYPINLAYQSGITMDQEATCVGLGWSINTGAIKRQLRGIPDDAKGDPVVKSFNVKDNITHGLTPAVGMELFGWNILNEAGEAVTHFGVNLPTIGVAHNNYTGPSVDVSITAGFSAGQPGGSKLTSSLGLTVNSMSGVSVNKNFSANINKIEGEDVNLGMSMGTGYNSRSGLRALSLGASFGLSPTQDDGNNYSKYWKNRVGSGSATFSFANPTYPTAFELPMVNTSISFSAKVGPENGGGFPTMELSGYYSKQSLHTNTLESHAYGFLYAQEQTQSRTILMDFNREKDIPFNQNTPHLPLTVFTNDVFSVNGQGVSGSYQLRRGDVGVLYDKEVRNHSNGWSIGTEAGIGNLARLGTDVTVNLLKSSSGRWDESSSNKVFNKLKFQKHDPDSLGFEPAYFKMAGEQTLDTDPGFFEQIGGFKAVRVGLENTSGTMLGVNTQEKFVKNLETEPGLSIDGPVKRKNRDPRNQLFSYLTAEEASQFGLNKTIDYYNFGEEKIRNKKRENGVNRKAYHISEITILKPGENPTRYFYGLPVYNLKHEEVSFSVNSAKANCKTELVEYEPDIENTIGNKSGRENYFNKIELPPYAHSYLLTGIVGDDYVDKGGDGLTLDDPGDYVKFSYYKLKNNYQWRVPYENNMANYNPGHKTDPLDDKGNYTFGEKEIFYTRSIESKTHIAVFSYSNRVDANGVIDENGGRDDDQKLKKLDKITFYTLLDYYNSPTPKPLKTVQFHYDYELCPGIPNSAGNLGKLTLKKLEIKYGDLLQGKITPYKFKYAGDASLSGPIGINPSYYMKSVDRWGSFKPNSPSSSCSYVAPLKNSEYPYVDQNNRETADRWSYAWHLREITTPSGSKINVEYEAHDYAYTQDKRAMELFEIVHLEDIGDPKILSSSEINANNLALFNPADTNQLNNRIYFKLKEPLSLNNYTPNEAKQYLRSNYLRDILNVRGHLYFKIFSDLDGNNNYEFVPGYAKIDRKEFGVISTGAAGGSWDYGYIELKPACIKDKEFSCSSSGDKVSPLAKASWQWARLNRPPIAFRQPLSPNPNVENYIRSLGALWTSVVQFVDGVNDNMRKNGFGLNARKGKSWIRLYSPERKKIAGGCRVKTITINDQWSEIAGNPHENQVYGQVYEYTKEEVVDGRIEELSSGVAAYEPLVGGDVNPMRQPIPYNEALLLAPDRELYMEEPLGESFFPGPQIVYSKVTVRNLRLEDNAAGFAYDDVESTATGRLEYEFYTAKDFPVITKNTKLKKIHRKTNPLLTLLKIKNKDYMNASEGFTIIKNNMHGVPKAEWVYNESGVRMSGVEYKYKRGVEGLGNAVTVINQDGSIEGNRHIGLDYQMVADAREGKTHSLSVGAQLNLDIFYAYGIVAVPTGYPTYNSEETRFRSITTTKVIHQTGLLEKTIVYDQASSVATENLAYDAHSGSVLLTRTTNSFDDPVYQFNFPAHWAYEGMEAAYQNIRMKYFDSSNPVQVNSGVANIYSGIDYLKRGDVLRLKDGRKAWVKDVDYNNATAYLIDKNGDPIDNAAVQFSALRSGHRNQQFSSMGSITTLGKNPLDVGLNFADSDVHVLNVGVVEYCDEWQTYCDGCEEYKLSDSGEAFEGFINYVINEDYFNSLLSFDPTQFSGFFDFFTAGGCDYNVCQTYQSYITIGNFNQYGDYYYQLNFGCNGVINECVGAKCEFGFNSPNFDATYNMSNIDRIKIDPNNNPIYSDGIEQKFILKGYWTDETTFDIEMTRHGCFLFCDIKECISNPAECNIYADNVNPFVEGVRGRWRPKRNWAYLIQRTEGVDISSPATTNIRKDGTYEYFSPFWISGGTGEKWVKNTASNDQNWTWASETTKIDPHGNELEARDALGNFSANVMSYNFTQVVASAKNARYNDIAFDDFDANYYSTALNDKFFSDVQCLPKEQFSFQEKEFGPMGHAGNYSTFLKANKSVSTEYKILQNCDPNDQCNPLSACKDVNPAFEPYVLQNCDCLGRFSPTPGRYVLSAWVSEKAKPDIMDFDDPKIVVDIDGDISEFRVSGDIIEMWQRIYGEFEIPPGAEKIKITLVAGKKDTWFDSFRIQPFNSSMQTFVYDINKLVPTHFLDENNYYTKYEYGFDLYPERIKKETERGVMTIQESRSFLKEK